MLGARAFPLDRARGRQASDGRSAKSLALLASRSGIGPELAEVDDEVRTSLAGLKPVAQDDNASPPIAPSDAGLRTDAPTGETVWPPAEPGARPPLVGPDHLARQDMRFRKDHAHARGGLGEVFVAIDEELGRDVAVDARVAERV